MIVGVARLVVYTPTLLDGEKMAPVTGSGGRIGSECARVLCQQRWNVVGIDNDMRSWFFGEAGSTAV
jgi:hypothetical protein